MLDENEEVIVEGLIELLKLPSHADKLVPERIMWLAVKLNEVNKELKELYLQIEHEKEFP